MSFNKPFHRNYRPVKEGHNSEYSDWAYIIDPDYSKNPEYYTRAFSIIQDDVIKLFEFIEPSDINNPTYSFRIHELLIRICIEIEANFKAILRENIYSSIDKKGTFIDEKDWNMNNFKIVNKTHHLDDYSVKLPFWKGEKNIRKPFLSWKTDNSLTWYQSYNQSKHNRVNSFEKASFENLIDAFAGLFVLLSSQFRYESFYTGGKSLGLGNEYNYFSGNFGIGDFLMIEFPKNWKQEELYEFDWSVLQNETQKFDKIDYNAL